MIKKCGQVLVTEGDVIVSGFEFIGPGGTLDALQWAIDRIRDARIDEFDFTVGRIEVEIQGPVDKSS